MKYIEAPAYISECGFSDDGITSENSIFLAGSITGAWDWQKEVADKLIHKWNVFNPRRENYNGLVPNAEREQITWEYKALRFCDNVLFYFSHETLAPITLFEYGKMLKSHKNLFVCIHSEYKRKNDVIIQTNLEHVFGRDNFGPAKHHEFCDDLDSLVEAVNNFK